METTLSLEALETLMAQNNELLTRIYINQLFVIGVVGALFVLFVLYNFIKKFY